MNRSTRPSPSTSPAHTLDAQPMRSSPEEPVASTKRPRSLRYTRIRGACPGGQARSRRPAGSSWVPFSVTRSAHPSSSRSIIATPQPLVSMMKRLRAASP
jgi:hypothetical protein